MDNVISFPTKVARNRAEMERLIREILHDANAPSEATEIVVANMAEFIDLLAFDFTFSFSMPVGASAAFCEQFEQFKVALDRRTAHLLAERIKVEIAHAISAST